VRQVGFITKKFVTMYGHMTYKKKCNVLAGLHHWRILINANKIGTKRRHADHIVGTDMIQCGLLVPIFMHLVPDRGGVTKILDF